jgi:CDGSH-type Zn-finger protein
LDDKDSTMEETKRSSPFVMDVTAGNYAWCACGYSQKQPYCDGSHRQSGTGKRPVIVDIAEDKKVAWCGCKKTGNQPFCDGSHSRG